MRLVLALAVASIVSCAAPKSAPISSSAARLIDASAGELLAHVRSTSAHATILNVWATWCDPCKEELPDFLAVAEKFRPRGVELVLVSADVASERPAVERFLDEIHVGFPTYMKRGGDMEFINGLEPRWSGALPITLIYGPGGKLAQLFEGRVPYDRLEKSVLSVLGGTP